MITTWTRPDGTKFSIASIGFEPTKLTYTKERMLLAYALALASWDVGREGPENWRLTCWFLEHDLDHVTMIDADTLQAIRTNERTRAVYERAKSKYQARKTPKGT